MICDAAHVRKVGNFPDSLSATVIDPHIRTAKRRLKRWVGASAYTTAETESEATGVPRDFSGVADATLDLADAEAYLAIAIGLPSFNTVMEGVTGGSAAGITMTGIVGENTYRYMNPDELKKMREKYLENAYEAAKDYLSDTTGGMSPGPGISYALDADGYEIDEDWPED